jgi:Fe-S cluster biogenesis protein NfuA
MAEIVLPKKILPEVLSNLIPTEKFRVQEDHGVIQLVPVNEKKEYEIELRGMFAGCPEMTVDRFIAEKQIEKKLDL